MDAQDLLPGDGQQAPGVVVPEVLLGGERQAGEAVETDPGAGPDTGAGQALAVQGAALGQPPEQVVQAPGLEAGPFVGRHPLGLWVPHGVHRSTSPAMRSCRHPILSPGPASDCRRVRGVS